MIESSSRSVVEQHFLDPFIGIVDNIKLDLTQEKIVHITIAIFAGLMCSTILMGVLIGLTTLYTTTAVSKYVKYNDEMKRIAEKIYRQELYSQQNIPYLELEKSYCRLDEDDCEVFARNSNPNATETTKTNKNGGIESSQELLNHASKHIFIQPIFGNNNSEYIST